MLPRRLAGRVYLVLSHEYTGLPDAVSILIDTGACRVLVDTGSGHPASDQALLASLARLGIRRGGLDLAVNTHAHLPNAGGDWFVHEVLGVVVGAWASEARAIESGDPDATAASEYGLPFRPVPVGLVLSREGPLPWCGEVRVIHTPGHTPGSVSYLYEDPDAGLVAAVGDALGRLSRRWGSSEEEWVSSAERLAGLEPEILCTSAACLRGAEARRFVRDALERGPEWI